MTATFRPSEAPRWGNCPGATVDIARMDAAVLRERARWLNWRSYLVAIDTKAPFTPYHAESRK